MLINHNGEHNITRVHEYVVPRVSVAGMYVVQGVGAVGDGSVADRLSSRGGTHSFRVL